MSWHCLPELVEEYSAGSCLDGEPCAPLKSTPSVGRCYSDGSWMDAYLSSLSGMTSEPLTVNRGEEKSTLLVEGSHAKTFQVQDQEKELKEKDLDYGLKCRALLLKWDQNLSSWKTHHCLFQEVLHWSLVILPKWGLMLDGVLFRQKMPKLYTNESDVGLWPTPRCWMAHGAIRKKTDSNFWGVVNIEDICGGAPDPNLVEWMMGWPMDWTDLKPLETAKFQQWLDSHGRH